MRCFSASEASLGAVTDRTDTQKNLDPAQLKEVQESQARMVKMQSSITSGDLSGWVLLVLLHPEYINLDLQTASHLCLRRVPVTAAPRLPR